jgi:hypothetical protein
LRNGLDAGGGASFCAGLLQCSQFGLLGVLGRSSEEKRDPNFLGLLLDGPDRVALRPVYSRPARAEELTEEA